MATGNPTQHTNILHENTTTTKNAILLYKIFTTRIKKLIILPCQSYCPNIGTKIFFIHTPGAKVMLPNCTIP